jgi:hypothetical protein
MGILPHRESGNIFPPHVCYNDMRHTVVQSIMVRCQAGSLPLLLPGEEATFCVASSIFHTLKPGASFFV